MSARVPARAALAGNPSDGYGGAVLAVTLPQLSAEVTLAPDASGGGGAIDLLEATLARFAREFGGRARVLDWQTSIPRSVGLGGSSAIVIAALRALCELHAVVLEPAELAELALSIERDDLGIAAGLQDRVAQAYGGLTFMDFSGPGRYERLDLGLLPPLLIAWRAHTARHSGVVHGDLLARFQAGEPLVHEGMRELGLIAARARDALLASDQRGLREAADASFEWRRRMVTLDPLHVEMVDTARAAGAGVNYTGSGGSVACICADQAALDRVAAALEAIGCLTMRL